MKKSDINLLKTKFIVTKQRVKKPKNKINPKVLIQH